MAALEVLPRQVPAAVNEAVSLPARNFAVFSRLSITRSTKLEQVTPRASISEFELILSRYRKAFQTYVLECLQGNSPSQPRISSARRRPAPLPTIDIFKVAMLNRNIHRIVLKMLQPHQLKDFGRYHYIDSIINVLYSKPNLRNIYTGSKQEAQNM